VLISLAVDFHAADVATRERFHLSSKRVDVLYGELAQNGLAEMVVINTCNRTELYAAVHQNGPVDVAALTRTLARRWMPDDADAAHLEALAAVRTGIGAARHALRVAAGLESQVLGDAQILGQFRRAHGVASSAGACGALLHRLFETALRAGKRVQARTALGSGSNSVGAQAVSIAVRRHPAIATARIAIVGCGKTGERVARQFLKLGATNLVLLNRSGSRSDELALELGVRSAPMATLYEELSHAEIAVVATGASEPVVDARHLAEARAGVDASTASLLLIDLSMPRNIDADVAALPGIALVDLDALHPVLTSAEQARRAAVPAAEQIVEAELEEFAEWLATACAREAIRPLHDTLTDACRRELSRAITEEEAERLSKRIVAKVMASPMLAIRETIARGETVDALTKSIQVLFAKPEFGAARE
jgi:glutamyl-tRNA reductase